MKLSGLLIQWNVHNVLSRSLGPDNSSKNPFTASLSTSRHLKNLLCVFFLRVILHTCSIGFRSGEYGCRNRNSAFSRISSNSPSLFSLNNLLAFLCQGALSITAVSSPFFRRTFDQESLQTGDSGFEIEPIQSVHPQLPGLRDDESAVRGVPPFKV